MTRPFFITLVTLLMLVACAPTVTVQPMPPVQNPTASPVPFSPEFIPPTMKPASTHTPAPGAGGEGVPSVPEQAVIATLLPEAGNPSNPPVDPAAANIQLILGNPQATPIFLYNTTHPENSAMPVAYYETGEAYFMVDPSTNLVMYMYYFNPPGMTGPELSTLELNQVVRAFLEQHVPCFPEVEEHLMLEIGGKGENRFFRWDAPQPDPSRPNDQPAFLQVAIKADGFIFGFIDSGVCSLVKE